MNSIGNYQKPSYYRPYSSDSESDSASDSDTASTTTGTDSDWSSTASYPPEPKSLIKAAGIPLNTVKEQLEFGVDQISKHTNYAYYEPPPPGSNIEYGNTIFNTNNSSLDNIIILNSRDRDRDVYPQPTNVVLRLPRVYKNITRIAFTDWKMLSAFYYFRPDKGNVTYYIEEQGRSNPFSLQGMPSNAFPITIDTGSYDINSLLKQLNQKMNLYPIFYYFVGGFTQFAQDFSSTGDLATGFNEVGDFFYDITNNIYISPPTLTRTYVTQTFFQNRYTNRTTFSLSEILCAYYYPPLKLYLLENLANLSTIQLNMTLTTSSNELLSFETPLSRVLYTMQGLDDPVVNEIITQNTSFLDIFRAQNTFLNAPVNKYSATVDTTQNITSIISPNLNTSLMTLLGNQYAAAFNNELQNRGLTMSNYNASNAQLLLLNTSLLSMYAYFQTQLAITYAINYNTYTLSYLATPSYQIYIRDGYNATNVDTTLTSNILYADKPPLSNYSLRIDPPIGSWSNLVNTQSNTYTLINNEQSPFVNYYSIYYNGPLQYPIVNPSTSNIYTNLARRSADLIVPVTAEKYSVLAFTSPVRQTLQIETLPRPLQYRYPVYNALCNTEVIQTLFNYQYEYIDNSNADATIPADVGGTWDQLLIPLSGIPFAQTYAQGRSNASNAIGTCGPYTPFTSVFYKITTPAVTNPAAFSVNKYAFAMDLVPGGAEEFTFATPISVFMYHDRAAFMADVQAPFHESPIHYKITSNISAGVSNISLQWNAYERNTYYILIRPTQIPFSKFTVKPILYFPNTSNVTSFTTQITTSFDPTIDPTTDPSFLGNYNYAKVYDPDCIRLPISSNLWGAEVPNEDANNTSISSFAPPIGYDTNGNSFDLTDYRPYSLLSAATAFKTRYYYDPIGRNQNAFNFISPYSTSNESYFYPGSLNSILIGSNQTYTNTPGPIFEREYKLVNWNDGVYIGPDIQTSVSNINTAYTKVPLSLSSTCNIPIGGYLYDTASNISFYDGVCGFTFLPDDGVWDLTSLTFNSAVMSKSNNNNHAIQYIGIYNTVQVYDGSIGQLTLSNALIVLQLARRQYYLPTQPQGYQPPMDANDIYYFYNSNTPPPVQYGSYYTFTPVTSSNMLFGYTENPRYFINTPEDLYSAIAFDSNGRVTPIAQLTGTLVPYPSLSVPQVSNTYFDGSRAPNGKQVIRPSVVAQGLLPYGIDFSQIGYEQSMIYTTTAVHMMNKTQQIYDEVAMRPWSGYTLQGPLTGVSAKVPGYIVLNDGSFKVYSYDIASANRILTLTNSFTTDAIFGEGSAIYPVTFGANARHVFFVGVQTVSVESNLVWLKKYEPTFGVFTSLVPTLYIPAAESVERVSIDGSSNCIFITHSTTNHTYNVYYYKPSVGSGLYASFTAPVSIDLQDNASNGRSVLASSNTVYTFSFTQFPSTTRTYTLSNVTSYEAGAIRDVVCGESSNIYYCLTSNNHWGQIRLSDPDPFAYLVTSTQQFQQQQTLLVSGTDTYPSKWSISSNTLYGNRYSLDGTVETAWQIFYPSYKFTFHKIANALVPIVDLTGIQPPEYFHTNLFMYDNAIALSNDIWNSWGAESNFLCADTQFRGYQFNSYINNVPLEPNRTYYMVVRGYAPSEQFETMIRFYLPNRYDFRWLTSIDISNEIQIATQFMASNNGLTPFNFNPTYALSLSRFNEAFVGPMTFGAGVILGYNGISSNPYGSNATWQGFGDFYFTYYTLYNQYVAINTLVNGIVSAANTAVNTFIATSLAGILPSNALTRARYTDPLLWSLLFGSGNSYQFSNLPEEWGIGWNLGFPKRDTPYLTKHTGDSFYKILDDYIYLKLNEEFNLNNIDSTGPENLKATRESTGLVGNYNSKIFLNTFGGFAQTAINNPIPLNPPVSRLDRISLQLFDFRGTPINNNNCEWSCSLHVIENFNIASTNSSLLQRTGTSLLQAAAVPSKN
jgi:hypothetical protein